MTTKQKATAKRKRAAKKGTAKKATAKKATGKTRRNGPVAKVWEIASSMKGKSRKEIVNACVKKGINVHTARTQYQRWLHRGDKVGSR